MFPGMMGAGFDPSKLDPKLIAEISELMASLPPPQMMKMQTIMHNSMAGLDVTKDVQEFEASLPPGFREKMARILYRANGVDLGGTIDVTPAVVSEPANESEARLTILKAVRDAKLSPEEAMKVLFP